MKFKVLVVIVMLSCTACTTLAETNTPTLAPQFATPTPGIQMDTPPPTAPRIPTDTFTFTATPTWIPAKLTPKTSSLSSEGPWVVYQNRSDGLIVINADGTGRTKFAELEGSYLRLVAASPTDPLISVVQLSGQLVILRLPGGEIETVIPLFSYFNDHPAPEAESDPTHWVFGGEPVWSPDGRYLAFIGVIDGPTTDVYVYDTQLGTVNQLTSGPNQAAYLAWSPDSRWIVHTEERTEFGAGFKLEAVWAAAVDGSQVKWLHSADTLYNILGWIGPATYMAYERHMGGTKNLKMVDVAQGTAFNFFTFEGGVALDFTLDPGSGMVAFYPNKYDENIPEFPESGVYFVSPSINTPKLIVPGSMLDESLCDPGVCWDADSGIFLTGFHCGNYLDVKRIAFNAQETISCVTPVVRETSPDGQWILWTEKGSLVVADSDGSPVAHLDQSATGYVSWELTSKNVYWRADGEGFFLAYQRELRYISLPDLNVFFVDEFSYNYSDLVDDDLIWVGNW